MSEIQNMQKSETVKVAAFPSRRSFVRGATLVAPIALTVGSRSAMATACLSPSATASISLAHSRPGRTTGNCIGRSPGYWKEASRTHADEWAQCGANGKLFSTCFVTGFTGKTLQQVMDMGGTEDPEQLGAHLSAAWCNLQMGWVDSAVLSLVVLQAMWANKDSYKPVAGADWGPKNIVDYLKTTMV